MLENEKNGKVDTGYFLPKVEIKDYNVTIGAQNLFDQSVKNDLKHIMTFKKLQQDKKMIIQLVVY